MNDDGDWRFKALAAAGGYSETNESAINDLKTVTKITFTLTLGKTLPTCNVLHFQENIWCHLEIFYRLHWSAQIDGYCHR